jgi:hypothetical protein
VRLPTPLGPSAHAPPLPPAPCRAPSPAQTPSCSLDAAANAQEIAAATLCPGTLMASAFPCALVSGGKRGLGDGGTARSGQAPSRGL